MHAIPKYAEIRENTTLKVCRESPPFCLVFVMPSHLSRLGYCYSIIEGLKASHVDRYHKSPWEGPEKVRDSMTAEEECADPDLGVVNAYNTNTNFSAF